jgi:hypothetical protein
MNLVKHFSLASLTALTIGAIFPTVAEAASFTVFSGTGTNAATAFEDMKSAIGGINNGTTVGSQGSGFRTINWDAVKLDGTDIDPDTEVIDSGKTVAIEVDRFQANGALFADPYAVSGDGYSSVNPDTAGEFPSFSPNNTFAMFDFDPNSFEDRFIEQSFTIPGSNSKAGTRGFGAIFTDVELAGSSSIEYFSGTKSLGKFDVTPSASGEPQFLGVLFDEAIVTDVTLTIGSKSLFNFDGNQINSFGAEDLANGIDLAVTDDFVFAEPEAIDNNGKVPEPSFAFSLLILGQWGLISFLQRRSKMQ